MTEKTRLQREERIKEARAELVKKYDEPYISGTKKVVEQVEEGAQIETVPTYLTKGIREKTGTIGVVTGITEEGIVTASLKCGGKIINLFGVLPREAEFWVIPSEPKDTNPNTLGL